MANVRVVKLMTFGAFAEVVPGVDGLIHISQIADHRIDKPGDVLSEGQMVDVKIIDIDYDNKKVSLSIRALLEGGDEPAESGGCQRGVIISIPAKPCCFRLKPHGFFIFTNKTHKMTCKG